MQAVNDLVEDKGQKKGIDSKSSTPTSDPESSNTPKIFHFWNGDEYEGMFVPVKEKHKLVMEGKGTYRTADGQIYSGYWENDCLKEAFITFKDKSVFTGCLEDMIIQGPGKYKFKENVDIEGEFVDNNLIGKVYLIDPTQHVWRGETKEDDTFCYFYPLHAFWQSVLALSAKDQIFYGESAEENDNIFEPF